MQAIEQIKLAAKAAVDFDSRHAEYSYSTLLLGKTDVKREDFDSSDSRPLAVILLDDWLADEDYGSVRNMPEFIEIIKMLSN